MFQLGRPVIATLLAAAILAGCIPRHPERTVRPEALSQPWEERIVRSPSGHEYRYLFAPGPSADAPAMVLLPGGLFDNRIWLYTSGLAERFNLYALDWPTSSLFYTGHATDYGEIVADFLAALGIEELYLAAVSMGAYGAVDLASRKGDRFSVKALVLVSAVMFAVDEEEVDTRTGYGEFALGLSPERLRGMVEWQVGRRDYPEAPGVVQQLDIFWVRPYPYYFQIFSMALNQGDRPQDTRAIACPVLFLHGSEDDTMLIEVARKNPQVFAEAEWREFEGLEHSMIFGHGPMLAEAILEFLEERGVLPEP